MKLPGVCMAAVGCQENNRILQNKITHYKTKHNAYCCDSSTRRMGGSMVKAEWKLKDLFKADAQKVADEISSLESRTPKTLLEYARNPDTELHKCYTWNDNEAAEKCRLYESRKILCNLVIAEVKEEKVEPTKLRLFHKTDGTEYKPIQFIVKNKPEYEVLLERATSELRAFKQKYSMLSELEEILALID